jgi:tetratricopeptide (TPR) repeat protein
VRSAGARAFPALLALAFVSSAALARGPSPARQPTGPTGQESVHTPALSPGAPAQAEPDDALRLGEAALRAGRLDEAQTLFEAALRARPDSVAAHLGLGSTYLARGDAARAKIEFETVLRFDELPPDLQRQAEIYGAAARAYAEGRRLLATGFAALGLGRDRPGAAAEEAESQPFATARFGGNLAWTGDGGLVVHGSLDYRHRAFDAAQRRDDGELFWDAGVHRNLGQGNVGVGLRGRLVRNDDRTSRSDAGVYADYLLRLDPDNQLGVGLEIRRRGGAAGPRRDRAADILELTGRWTRALFAGRAGVALEARIGRRIDTARADGEATYFALAPTVSVGIARGLGAFVSVWWQKDRLDDARPDGPGGRPVGIGPRDDVPLELGAGLSWSFAPGWTLNPEVLHLRDVGNAPDGKDGATEFWITVRRDF